MRTLGLVNWTIGPVATPNPTFFHSTSTYLFKQKLPVYHTRTWSSSLSGSGIIPLASVGVKLQSLQGTDTETWVFPILDSCSMPFRFDIIISTREL